MEKRKNKSHVSEIGTHGGQPPGSRQSHNREESFRRSKEAQSISLSLKAYLGSGQYLKEKRRKGNSYAFLRKGWQTQPKIMAAHEECIKGQKF